MAPESDDDLLTPVQAGKILGLSRWTIAKLADDGKLEAVEISVGRDRKPDRRFRRGDVNAYRKGQPGRLVELEQRVADLEAWRAKLEQPPD